MSRYAIGMLILVGALASGCRSGPMLRGDAVQIAKKLEMARENGAYNCAPMQLAQAEAHLEFLEYELDEGDFQRASWHHRAATQNADTAFAITDPDKCADREVLIADAAPVIIKSTDRDLDGILDEVDQCPDEPEDKDTFEDLNGCPDPDNDADMVLDINDVCPLEPGSVENRGCPVADRDGDGIGDDVDQCVNEPEDIDGFQDEDGCPEADDIDGDGILDQVDKCPTEPEDIDNYLDEDGCPELDNDEDGVVDMSDLCPIQPGPMTNAGCPVADRDNDGVNDEVDQCPDVPGQAPTGCPKRVLVEVKGSQIEIKEKINFESNGSAIAGGLSFEIIDQVAQVFKSNPGIRVKIEGHTDSSGAADYNLKLSDSRANAVRKALIERGIEADRLEAIGYGESKPISSNSSSKGRAQNRRVEFNILKK